MKLGEHAFTGEKVWFSTLTKLFSKVAIKILEKAKIMESADVERVAREIKILKMVRHPYII